MDPLDDNVRDAFRALEAQETPRDYFDELPGRIDARLAAETQGESMHTSESHDENSGLHDIKALAQTTRQRISRRQTSQHDIDEAVLSASGSGLHAVALPDPAKVVSLPTIEEARALARSASLAAVDEDGTRRGPVRAAAMPAESRGRGVPIWMWAGGGVAAAAAAVLAFTAIGGKGSSSSEPKTQSAAMPQGSASASSTAAAEPRREQAMPPAPPTAAAPTVQAITTDGIAEQGAPGAGMASGSGSGSAAGSAAPANADDAEAAAPADHAVRAHKGGESVKDATDKGVDTSKKSDSGKGKPDATSAKDTTGASSGGTAKKQRNDLDGAVLGAGDKDELGIGAVMDGGGNKKKDAAPTRTELSDKEMRAGLAAIEGKAKGCYDKYQVAGTAKVKLTIEPSGKVGKATATGDFAGTPTGTCVEAAVRSASFPAWTGGPTSTMFVVLLSD